MGDEQGRRIRLRGSGVHNLKGIDLDLPLDRLVVFTRRQRVGQELAGLRHAVCRGPAAVHRDVLEPTRASSSNARQARRRPIDGIPPADRGRPARGAAVEPEHGRQRHRAPRVPRPALRPGRAGRSASTAAGRSSRPSPATVVAGDRGLAGGVAVPDRLPAGGPPRIGPRWPWPMRSAAEGFTRVGPGWHRPDRDAGSGPLPLPGDEGGVIDVIVDRLVRGSDDPRASRSTRSRRPSPRGWGGAGSSARPGALTFYQGWRCAGCGRDYLEPDPRLFRYNSPLGACPTCEGFGRVIDLDLGRIVPDPSQTRSATGRSLPGRPRRIAGTRTNCCDAAPELGVPDRRAVRAAEPRAGADRSSRASRSAGSRGLRGFFRWLESKSYKMHVRVFLSRWRSYRPCPACRGARLRPEALAVKVGGLDIAARPGADGASRRGRSWPGSTESDGTNPVVRRILERVERRLDYLDRIGLGYLTLDRQARTLSGGEAQRVALTAALGLGAGQHALRARRAVGRPAPARRRPPDRDPARAPRRGQLGRRRRARRGGPARGRHARRHRPGGRGGRAGACSTRARSRGSPTSPRSPPATSSPAAAGWPSPRAGGPPTRASSRLTGARGHNLKGIDVAFPLGVLCLVTGVSGSGKSTLVEETLYPALPPPIHGEPLPAAPYDDADRRRGARRRRRWSTRPRSAGRRAPTR